MKKENMALLVFYIDDILLIENAIKSCLISKVGLSKQFQIKNLGEINYVLAIQLILDGKDKLLALP